MSESDDTLPEVEHEEVVEPNDEELRQLEAEAEELEQSAASSGFEKGEDPIANYLRSFPSITPLTHQEFLAVHARWRETGAQDLFDLLIYRNMLLCVAVARRYHHGVHGLLDAVQDGIFGIIRALHEYDASRGFRFSTMAQWWIRHHIGRARENSSWSTAFRIPIHEYSLRGKIHRIVRHFEQQFQREPTDEEVLVRLYSPEKIAGFSEQRKERRLRKIATSRRRYHQDRTLSFDTPATESKDGSEGRAIGDTISSALPLADAQVLVKQVTSGPTSIVTRIRAMAEQLTPAEQIVYYGRFIFSDTLKRVGERMGISRERVRQLQNRIVRRFARRLRMEPASVLAILDALGEMKLLDLPMPPAPIQAYILAQLPSTPELMLPPTPPTPSEPSPKPTLPAPRANLWPRPSTPTSLAVLRALPLPLAPAPALPLPTRDVPKLLPPPATAPPTPTRVERQKPQPKPARLPKPPKPAKPPKPLKLIKVRYPFPYQGNAAHSYVADQLVRMEPDGSLLDQDELWLIESKLVERYRISPSHLHVLAYEKKIRHQPGLSTNGRTGLIFYAVNDVLRAISG